MDTDPPTPRQVPTFVRARRAWWYDAVRATQGYDFDDITVTRDTGDGLAWEVVITASGGRYRLRGNTTEAVIDSARFGDALTEIKARRGVTDLGDAQTILCRHGIADATPNQAPQHWRSYT